MTFSSILSFLLSFVMFASGTATLPASPEYRNELTLSDLSLTIGENTFTLDADVTIANAISEEGIELGVNAVQGDKTLIPATLSLKDDGVRLQLNGSDHYYYLSADTIDSFIGEAENTLPAYTELFDSLQPVSTYFTSLDDPEVLTAGLEEYLNAYVTANAVSAENVTVTVAGETLEGRRITLNNTGNNALAMLDILAASENKELSAAMTSVLNAISTVSGQKITSFAELGSEEVTAGVPATLIVASNEDGTIGCQRWNSSLTTENGSFDITANIDSIDGDASVNIAIDASSEQFVMQFTLQFTADAQEDGSCLISGSYDLSNQQDVVYPATDGDETSEMSDTILSTTHFDVDGMVSEASESVSYHGIIEYSSLYSEADDAITLAVDADVDRKKADDSSVSTNYQFSVSGIKDIDTVATSFTLTSATAPYTEAFGGEEIIIDETIADTPSTYMKLISDGSAYGSEAIELFTSILPEDFSWEQFKELFKPTVSDSTNVDAVDEIEDADEPDDLPEEDELHTVSSIEEAREYYTGTIPDITTPAGYELSSVYVNSNSVSIDYFNSEDNSLYIGLYMFADWTADEDSENKFFEENGNVYSANLYIDGVEVDAYFSDMPRADVEALLSEMGLM